ncbi:MAG: tRNA-(ms[2]io[6]A)-hydroxylase [Gammaproteobacteria bacterium]|nr:MAG: tRNA-(ms[2]io[6]A)-hydroxylase [Gammaproteobacteria bacterium]
MRGDADGVAAVRAFLACPTPAAWIEAAGAQLEVLLLDHANCERKAAATAVSLLFRYDSVADLAPRMSRLAREELRHYEQVLGLLSARNIAVRPISASRYAGGLRAGVRAGEPERLLDLLLVGALVEARSCERFAALIPVLDEDLARFYRRLLASEARHFEDYLQLARSVAGAQAVSSRLVTLKDLEADLITRPDPSFRFHSGPPECGQG